MCPITHFSFLALGAGTIANFILGAIWYGPLFGKTWATLQGFNVEGCNGKPPAKALIITFIGSFLTTFVLAYIFNATKCCHFCLSLLIWAGFYLPVLVGVVTWEKKSWKLFAINAGFYLLSLELIAAVLTFVK